MSILGAAAIGAAGGLLGSAMDFAGARSANRHNLASAREQMAFQEFQSNTAHQREVEDLRLAGLNPLLSVNKGAAAPSGAMSTFQNEMAGAGHHISRTAASASEASRMQAEIAKLKADTALSGVMARQAESNILNNAMTTASQVRLQNAQGDLADSNTAMNAVTVKNVLQNMQLKSPMAPLAGLAHDVTSGAVNFVKGAPGFFDRLTTHARNVRADFDRRKRR